MASLSTIRKSECFWWSTRFSFGVRQTLVGLPMFHEVADCKTDRVSALSEDRAKAEFVLSCLDPLDITLMLRFSGREEIKA